MTLTCADFPATERGYDPNHAKEEQLAKKHSITRREGGPGASHENRKSPRKSKTFGERNTKTKTSEPRPKERVKGRHKAR
jgi:hypothetical protein